MRISTKRTLLRAATAAVVVCAAAIVFLPAVSSATPVSYASPTLHPGVSLGDIDTVISPVRAR